MNYEEISKQLQDYYSNLLIIQYNGKTKAKATIELLARLVWSNMTLMQIRDGFDWETAEGAQLDVIGQWVGVSRDYTNDGTWGNAFLAYPSWDDSTDTLQGGYSDYTNFDTLEGGVLTYEDLNTFKQELNDDNYRIIIGLKIIKNNIINNQGNIDKAIWDYFEGKVYTSWQPHRLTYYYDSSLSTVMNICFKKGVLPTPTGVKVNILEIE